MAASIQLLKIETIYMSTATLLKEVEQQPSERQQLPSLEIELRGAQLRIAEYKQRIAVADRIIIMGGCDDGRVGAPAQLFEEGGLRTLVIYIPIIGGGVVGADQIQQVVESCIAHGATQDAISVIWTQHGNSTEIEQALACKHNQTISQDCISCGLRGVLATASKEFSSFFQAHAKLIREKRALSYGQLLASIDTADNQGQIFLNVLSVIALQFGVPTRLIWIALTQNYAGDMVENLLSVTNTLRSDLRLIESTVPIYSGLFDHKKATVTVVKPGIETKIIADGDPIKLPLRSHHEDMDYQDPRVVVISVGPDFHIPDGIIFPHRVGSDQIDNDFSAASLRVTQEDILNKLAEVSYSAHVKNVGHGKNFKHAEEMIIRCSTQAETAVVLQALSTPEFIQEMRSLFAAAFGKISIVTLETGSVIEFSL